MEEPVLNKKSIEATTEAPDELEEINGVEKALKERLESHDENRKAVQERLHSTCEKWRKQIDELEDKVNSELEAAYKNEDGRLQAALSSLVATASTKDNVKTLEALQKTKATLLIKQTYELEDLSPKGKCPSGGEDDFSKMLKLVIKKNVAPSMA